jgi:hypothetical protein
VREDSFACKEISDLDRLLQINQRGGFTSGTQLYVYLQRHNCIGLTEGRRACVREQGTICLHLRFEEQEQDYQALRLDEKGDAEMKTPLMATRQHRIDDFNSGGDPPAGYLMELLCEDHNGTYVLPFPCRWVDGAWRSIRSDHQIEAKVIGWRRQ